MRKWAVGIGTVLVVLCGGLCVWSIWLTRVANIPIPPRRYPPNNAYHYLREIGLHYHKSRPRNFQFREIEKKVQEQLLTPQERALYIGPAEPFLKEYRRYLHLPSVAVFEYRPDWAFIDLLAFRELAQAESYLIREALHHQREQEAVERFQSVLRFSNKIRSEGLIIHYLTGIAMNRFASRPFWENLPQTQEGLQEVIRAVQRFEQERFPAWKTIEHERFGCLALFREVARTGHTIEELSSGTPPEPRTFFSLKQRNRTLARLQVHRALPELHQLMDKAETELKKPSWERALDLPPPTSPLNQQLFTGEFIKKLGLLEAEELAFLRLVAVASAIRLHKLRTGQYPANLEVLNLGDLIIDPFSGKPLRYRIEPKKGFLLYSIGPDKVDDGGTTVYRDTSLGSGDIVFLFSR